jgi:hypothetical protein
MEYAVLFRWKDNDTRAQREVALKRLKEGSYPSGLELVAAYELEAEDIAALSIFRAVDRVALLEIEMTFGEIFDVSVLPASSIEGLEKW